MLHRQPLSTPSLTLPRRAGEGKRGDSLRDFPSSLRRFVVSSLQNTNPAVCRPPGLSFLERGLHTVQPRQGHGLNVQPPGTVTQFRHWITSLELRVSPAAASVTTRRRALFPLGVPRGSSPAPVSKRSREAGSRAGRSSWFAAAARRGVLPRFGDRSPRGTGSRLQRDASGLPNPIIARRCGSSKIKNPGLASAVGPAVAGRTAFYMNGP